MTDAERQDMTCATCVWRRPFSNDERKRAGLAREDVGECRRMPPNPFPGETFSVFPVVLDSEWCGEWHK